MSLKRWTVGALAAVVAALVAAWWLGRSPLQERVAVEREVPSLSKLSAAREQVIEAYRITGALDATTLRRQERSLKALLRQDQEAEVATAAELELGTVLRLLGRYTEAIEHLNTAEENARQGGFTAMEVDSAIGLARSHVAGFSNHVAAAEALERAEVAEAQLGGRVRRYELSSYSAEMQAARGRFDSALASALSALAVAHEGADRFYAQYDLGNILLAFAHSCDYRLLTDSRSPSDGVDLRGPCRRAVEGAERYYTEASRSAEQFGWTYLVEELKRVQDVVQGRKLLIQSQASIEAAIRGPRFIQPPLDAVVVDDSFKAGVSTWGSAESLAALVQTLGVDPGDTSAGNHYLLAGLAELGDRGDAALEHYRKAAAAALRERESIGHQRTTLLEDDSSMGRDLGLRLLARSELEFAFSVFESSRAHGVTALRHAYAHHGFGAEDRQFLAALLTAQTVEQQRLQQVTALALADATRAEVQHAVAAYRRAKTESRWLQQQPQRVPMLRRVGQTKVPPLALAELQAAVEKSGVPVLLYWVTPANVLVWEVYAHGIRVRTVFLPEHVLRGQVATLQASLRQPEEPYARETAMQLYSLLIEPFTQALNAENLLVIPQGQLHSIPFEALINPKSGRFLVEERAVSYAPNATLAAAMLRRPWRKPSVVSVFFDEQVEDSFTELEHVELQSALEVTTFPIKQRSKAQTLSRLQDATHAHMLMQTRSLGAGGLDTVHFKDGDADSAMAVNAAELAAIDLNDMQLMVFSDSEGGMFEPGGHGRLAYLAWAPLAAGAANVVLHRFVVSRVYHGLWTEHFYRALGMAQRPAAASAHAMQAMLSEPTTSHPYYWAAPMVLGY